MHSIMESVPDDDDEKQDNQDGNDDDTLTKVTVTQSYDTFQALYTQWLIRLAQ